MPSFDIVSEVDLHEAANAVDQANREVSTRFDFKGSGARFELEGEQITLHAQNDFQLKQMLDILQMKLSKRGVDIACLDIGEPQISGQAAHQTVILRQGIDKELAKKITKRIKDTKLKVQASIQGEKVRVTGKKRDDLQKVIQTLREAKLDLPLQFINFRD
ncbi:MAG: YajQ family cyclic di-GMP-binding protein [Methylothermaceae bacteria B42]|nr:MAG: YajQ family cyclic di-GMP-binding protein [Methylothermaceae bacteria B42]HHJ39464.1 YajQ family cyclic di-GMP-binding protein [Methylothermaceae bacterium]